MKKAAEDLLQRPREGAPEMVEQRAGTVLVYTAEVLPYSETFVRDHVASLKGRNAILVGAKAVAGLSTEGLITALLPEGRWSRLLLWTAGISPALDKLVKDHDVQLIHAHFADGGARVANYARRCGLPLVVTLHGSDVLRHPRKSARALLNFYLWRDLMRSTDLFLPVSNHIARAAAARGFPAAKLRLHYLGIPIGPRVERTANNEAAPIILFVGRMAEKKGLPYLIEACHILAGRGRNFRLKVIGDGPMLEKCRAEAKLLAKKVAFLGRLAPERVQKELAVASIFCMPSVEAKDGDNEGLPIVSLEAQAAALPVVAFDQGPVPEAVGADVTGLLAKNGSSEDLADCLERLLLDPKLRRRLGEQGRRNVEKNFNIESQSRLLEETYDSVLAQRSDARKADRFRGLLR